MQWCNSENYWCNSLIPMYIIELPIPVYTDYNTPLVLDLITVAAIALLSFQFVNESFVTSYPTHDLSVYFPPPIVLS